MTDTEPTIVLHVCTSCRAGTERVEGQDWPGQVLHDRVAALMRTGEPAPGLVLRGIECLARCNDGCTASIAMPDKWAYLLGRLDPDKAADLLAFAGSYGLSRNGTVMPSKRPASLADMVLGRIPAATQGVPA